MKIKTKKKIIKWVMNMLNYNEYMNPLPNWKETQKKIRIVRSERIYAKQEAHILSDDQIRSEVNLPLVNQLMNINAIKYTQEIDEDSGGTKVRAEINIILP